MDSTTAVILANEARRQELKSRVAQYQGELSAIDKASVTLNAFAVNLTSQYTQKHTELSNAKDELALLESGAGPGLTEYFGEYSGTDKAMRTERFAGKAAAVEAVKANPECTEDEATAAYTVAALAARPAERQWLLQDPVALRKEYSANLKSFGYIPDETWESWRAWILATPTEVILGLS